MKNRVVNVLFWSVLAAAFIGPGTVTTAASAGAGFGASLIWALLFSTLACFVLQEASARITRVSGLTLGEAMKQKYGNSKGGKAVLILALVSILTGCAAFEAGNILGAVAGIKIVFGNAPTFLLVLFIGITASLLLWFGSVRQIATFLGFVVAIMGFSFLITAFFVIGEFEFNLAQIFVPTIPPGSELLVLGLIGTTVVPYNIFLGSGLKHSQSVSEMKISMFIAIGLGGIISISILITGMAISGAFSFEALAAALGDRLGGWSVWLLAIGLFGAGLSSALTAALAASLTARSILKNKGNKLKWADTGSYFRGVWVTILAVGLLFGLLQLQPIPVIIVAQALNGIILPVIAIILYLLINNNDLIPPAYKNGFAYNGITTAIIYLTLLIGLTNVFRALARAIGFEVPSIWVLVLLSFVIFMIISIPLFRKVKN